GDHAMLSGSGAIDISARGQGDVAVKINAETYGAGTVTTGVSLADVKPVNQIFVAAGAHMLARGDLNLTTGRDRNAVADPYSLESRFDGFAGSAIPIDDIDARAFLFQDNRITVDAGALLETARTARLAAERNSLSDMVAKAKAVSSVSVVGDALHSLIGGGGEEQYNGRLHAEAHGSVELNGMERTG